MTKSNYKACLAHVLKWEGGYSDHPRDPGGATNYGITQGTLAAWRNRRVTKQDVRDLTLNEAGEIYRPRYWNAVQGDNLPDGFDLVAFDGGVNSGPSRGAKWLQRALGVQADGKIGVKTLTAASLAKDRVAVIQRAGRARMGFLHVLKTWSTFGRGWARRVADTEAAAVAMASQSKTRVRIEVDKALRVKSSQQKAGSGAVVSGGAGSLTGLPDWAVWLVLGIAVATAIILAVKAAHNGRRAAAYAAKVEEM